MTWPSTTFPAVAVPDAVSLSLPTERPPIDPDSFQAPTQFDWFKLIGLAVHPLKVAVIEALLWVGHPLSVAEMSQVLADSHYSTDTIGYQVTALARVGVIAITHVRRARGAREKYYSIAQPCSGWRQ